LQSSRATGSSCTCQSHQAVHCLDRPRYAPAWMRSPMSDRHQERAHKVFHLGLGATWHHSRYRGCTSAAVSYHSACFQTQKMQEKEACGLSLSRVLANSNPDTDTGRPLPFALLSYQSPSSRSGALVSRFNFVKRTHCMGPVWQYIWKHSDYLYHERDSNVARAIMEPG